MTITIIICNTDGRKKDGLRNWRLDLESTRGGSLVF
jgi:hypothetical protein